MKLKILFILLFFIPSLSWGAVTLPWATSFTGTGCTDAWTQNPGVEPVDPTCDSLLHYGNWLCTTDSPSKTSSISSSSNYISGGGGKGFRQYIGDGSNIGSGELVLTFSSSQPELWIRWYMRFEVGFAWSSIGYDKWIYLYTDEGTEVIPEWYGSDGIRIFSQGVTPPPGENAATCVSCGWQTVMGGTTSDGLWHSYEVHIKMDTNGSNGIAQMWIDGNQKFNVTNMNYGTKTGWVWFHFMSNQATPNNLKCMYQDVDDMTVSNTGYIGPLGGSGLTLGSGGSMSLGSGGNIKF